MIYYVYILKLSNGTYYKGITSDLNRRLKEHRIGTCKATRKYLPFILIYYEVFPDRILARKREKYFKSGIGRELIKQIDKARVAELADAQS